MFRSEDTKLTEVISVKFKNRGKVYFFDPHGIAVRTGQHCAEPVMTHYGVPGMCRASLAMYNTCGEIDALAAGVERAVRMLR